MALSCRSAWPLQRPVSDSGGIIGAVLTPALVGALRLAGKFLSWASKPRKARILAKLAGRAGPGTIRFGADSTAQLCRVLESGGASSRYFGRCLAGHLEIESTDLEGSTKVSSLLSEVGALHVPAPPHRNPPSEP